MTEESINKGHDQRGADPQFHHFIVPDEKGQRCGEIHFDLVGAYAGLDIKLFVEVQGRALQP